MGVYDDYSALRRYLIEDGHLTRDRAGREYRLPGQAPDRGSAFRTYCVKAEPSAVAASHSGSRSRQSDQPCA